MKNYFLLLCTCLLTVYTNAQTDFGGHPLGQDWHVVKSPAARVIYPIGMEASAQRVARIVNYINENNRRSIGNKKRTVDIVLQTQTVNPNGYVALAPLRSEFFLTPTPNNTTLSSLDWVDILSVHEYRHVLQNLNGNNGITKLAYWLQGESIRTFLNVLVTPNWYYEGDAVINETALTESGRGRTPYFTITQRALLHANLDYKYIKARNGSYKDLVPNHYPLGYLMLNYVRNHYGNDITAQIFKEATCFKGIFYPFSKAVKRHTGYTTTELYQKAWEEFKEKNQTLLNNTELINTTVITPKNKETFTSYSFPVLLDDGSIFARKSSYKNTDEIVKIKDGKEKKITSIGYNQDSWLSYNNGLLAWTELTKDIRRNHQDFSDIITYNVKTDKKNRLTSQTRYFSPSVSPDGKQIATISVDIFEKSKLLLIDSETGDLDKTFENPEGYFLSRINWSEDGKQIVTIAKKNGKLAILKINVDTNQTTILTPWSRHTMESPVIKNNKVYFNASYSGIDNIYAVDLDGNQKIQQISSVPVGAFEPSVNNNKIIFTEFTEMGSIITGQDLNTTVTNSDFTFLEPKEMEQFNTVAIETEGGNILDKVGDQVYKTEDYGGLLKGLKLHSWGLIPSISTPAVYVNIVNLLNDVSVDLGGGINKNEDSNTFYSASVKISRFYPEFSLNVLHSNRSTDYLNPNNNDIEELTYSETNLGATVDVPFSWLKGNYNSWITPYVGANHYILSDLETGTTEYNDDNFNSYTAGIYLGTLRRTAYQNVGPRGGFTLETYLTKGIKSSDIEKTFINGNLYLPGLSANHNVRLRGSYQKELLDNIYQFTDTFEYTRGYSTPVVDEFTNFSFNYQLPLFYPDLGYNGIIYFKRIRTNLFYDYGIGKNNTTNIKTQYNSMGGELLFDYTTLNLINISLGVRGSYLINKDPLSPNKKSDFTFFFATQF